MSCILLQNIEVLFQSRDRELKGVDLLIEDREIRSIGQNLTPPPGSRMVNCRGKAVLPGLINCHHHFFQTLTRCHPGAQNAGLFDWLVYHYKVWKHFDADMFRASNRLAVAELLLTGCTTAADHLYLYPKGVSEDLAALQAATTKDMGIRFCGTRGSMTLGESGGGLPPDDLCEDDEQVLKHCEECIDRFHNPEPFSMCTMHLAPCSPFNVTSHLLEESAKLARKRGVRLHTHLAETLDELDFCLEKYRRTPLEYMEDLDWLGEDVWFAHGVQFDSGELKKLAESGCAIAHCPSSNMRLGSGAARIPEMIQMGIPVGIAVDGSASNDGSDMLGELRQALLLGRVKFGSDSLTVRQMLSAATEGSARVLGRDDIGTLEEGKAADIAVFDLNRLQYAGTEADPVAALVLAGYDHSAWMVIVNGQVVVEDENLLTDDVESIRVEASRQSRRLLKKAGLSA